MQSLRQRQGNRQKHALMRNELRYLCYLPPQLCPARHTNVVAAIDGFPQFTSLMERVSNSVTYFLHPTPQCTHAHKHKHLSTHFPELFNQKPLSELWGRSKTSKVKAASGCVGRKLYYVIMLLGRFYFPVMKVVLCHKNVSHSGTKKDGLIPYTVPVCLAYQICCILYSVLGFL